MRIGKQSWKFENSVYLQETATAVGPLEFEGPLQEYFDIKYTDPYCGQKSWEQAESQLMRSAIQTVFNKSNISEDEIDVSFAGDLVNQIVPTHYVFREFNIPFFGVYGACSTSMESLLLSSIFVNTDSANHNDCGKLIFSPDQPVFAGGSGCGCCAVVTYGYIKKLIIEKKIKRVLVVATGALLNTIILQQKETIPCIAHAVALVAE